MGVGEIDIRYTGDSMAIKLDTAENVTQLPSRTEQNYVTKTTEKVDAPIDAKSKKITVSSKIKTTSAKGIHSVPPSLLACRKKLSIASSRSSSTVRSFLTTVTKLLNENQWDDGLNILVKFFNGTYDEAEDDTAGLGESDPSATSELNTLLFPSMVLQLSELADVISLLFYKLHKVGEEGERDHFPLRQLVCDIQTVVLVCLATKLDFYPTEQMKVRNLAYIALNTASYHPRFIDALSIVFHTIDGSEHQDCFFSYLTRWCYSCDILQPLFESYTIGLARNGKFTALLMILSCYDEVKPLLDPLLKMLDTSESVSDTILVTGVNQATVSTLRFPAVVIKMMILHFIGVESPAVEIVSPLKWKDGSSGRNHDVMIALMSLLMCYKKTYKVLIHRKWHFTLAYANYELERLHHESTRQYLRYCMAGDTPESTDCVEDCDQIGFLLLDCMLAHVLMSDELVALRYLEIVKKYTFEAEMLTGFVPTKHFCWNPCSSPWSYLYFSTEEERTVPAEVFFDVMIERLPTRFPDEASLSEIGIFNAKFFEDAEGDFDDLPNLQEPRSTTLRSAIEILSKTTNMRLRGNAAVSELTEIFGKNTAVPSTVYHNRTVASVANKNSVEDVTINCILNGCDATRDCTRRRIDDTVTNREPSSRVLFYTTSEFLHLFGDSHEQIACVREEFRLLELMSRIAERDFVSSPTLYEEAIDIGIKETPMQVIKRTISELTGCNLGRLDICYMRILENFDSVYGLSSTFTGLSHRPVSFTKALNVPPCSFAILLLPFIGNYATRYLQPEFELDDGSSEPQVLTYNDVEFTKVFPTLLPRHIAVHFNSLISQRILRFNPRERRICGWKILLAELCSAACYSNNMGNIRVITPHVDNCLAVILTALYVESGNPRALHLASRFGILRAFIPAHKLYVMLDRLLRLAMYSKFTLLSDAFSRLNLTSRVAAQRILQLCLGLCLASSDFVRAERFMRKLLNRDEMIPIIAAWRRKLTTFKPINKDELVKQALASVKQLVFTNDVDGAVEMFHKMRDSPGGLLDVSVANKILHLCVTSDRLDHAVNIIRLLRHDAQIDLNKMSCLPGLCVKPDVVTCNILIQGLGRKPDVSVHEIIDYISFMERPFHKGGDGVKSDQVTFHTAMSVAAHYNDFNSVCLLIGMMIDRSINIDSFVYSLIRKQLISLIEPASTRSEYLIGNEPTSSEHDVVNSTRRAQSGVPVMIDKKNLKIYKHCIEQMALHAVKSKETLTYPILYGMIRIMKLVEHYDGLREILAAILQSKFDETNTLLISALAYGYSILKDQVAVNDLILRLRNGNINTTVMTHVIEIAANLNNPLLFRTVRSWAPYVKLATPSCQLLLETCVTYLQETNRADNPAEVDATANVLKKLLSTNENALGGLGKEGLKNLIRIFLPRDLSFALQLMNQFMSLHAPDVTLCRDILSRLMTAPDACTYGADIRKILSYCSASLTIGDYNIIFNSIIDKRPDSYQDLRQQFMNLLFSTLMSNNVAPNNDTLEIFLTYYSATGNLAAVSSFADLLPSIGQFKISQKRLIQIVNIFLAHNAVSQCVKYLDYAKRVFGPDSNVYFTIYGMVFRNSFQRGEWKLLSDLIED